MKLESILKAVFAAEEAIIPVFVHDPVSQTIAAVILATEATVLTTFGVSVAPAATTTPAS